MKIFCFRLFYFLLFLFQSQFCFSQTSVQGVVKDLKTKSPLPFCAVAVRGSDRGCITNEEGVFKITVDAERDTLAFSYVGYKSRMIPASSLVEYPAIFLEGRSMDLKEVTVHAGDDYLYEIMDRCRKKILESKLQIAKIYFQLETEIQNKPVEMLEAYYNGDVIRGAIENLNIKNGRIGLAEFEHGSFVNINTSKAISSLNLTKRYDFLPSVPLQFTKSKLRKNYSVKILTEFSDENIFHLEFAPRENASENFSGEIWIDKKTYSILKINLEIKNSSVYPFLPLWQGDSLSNINMNISESYSMNGNKSFLNHVSFNYQLEYIDSAHKNGSVSTGHSRNINVTGILHFYDYEKPFTVPYFKYDTNESDYRKILSLPDNESFWKNNTRLVFTEKQNRVLEFFANHGRVINYGRKLFNGSPDKFSFEFNSFIHWSDSTRLQLSKNNLDSILRKNAPTEKSPQTKSEMYNLVAQLFLDVDSSDISVQYLSATIFDATQSFYNLPEEPVTNCFINIYFDICEIERRKMEKILSVHMYTLAQIDSVYRQTLEALNEKTERYFKEVQRGSNGTALKNWNTYVMEELNIDNFRILGVQKK